MVHSQKSAIAYYRVSRKRQAESGLGLEAQRASVKHYVEMNQLLLVSEYVEVETGTMRRQRPEVIKAIEEARQTGATLLIARLDRLARNVAFTSQLQESQVPFVCVDMPTANHTTIQLMAVIAEYEARVNSQRTKEALQAAKTRGVRLGSPKPMSETIRAQGREVRRAQQVAAYKPLFGYIDLMNKSGMSLRATAQQLNQEGHRTRGGKLWSPTQISRVLALYRQINSSE